MRSATEPVIAVACGRPRPRWRGRIHTYAFLAAIPAALILVLVSNTTLERIGVGVYWVSFAAVFGVSAAYHRLAISEKAQRIMRKADHATVFVKIAGTYTPICLLALPREWGIPILIAVWSIAAVGVLVKLLAPARYIRWSSPLYLAIGWVAIIALPTLIQSLTSIELVLLLIGGAVYSVGAVLFWMGRPDPSPLTFGYHEIWHVMTVVAAAFHFGLIVLVTTAA
ncbi:MAG: PAQR family membrane homeostasis protein TrhA [Acidimicrobiales bacterium]